MDFNQLAKNIVSNIGGAENVSEAEHCSTRLRFNVKDTSLINKTALKDLEGVAGVVDQAGGVQVIIGTEVSKVFDEMKKEYTFKASETAEPAEDANMSPFRKIMNKLADCFVPLIPALIAAGLMSAVTTLISSFHLMDTASTTYRLLEILGDAPLYFIPFMLASSAAKRFKVNPFITMCVVATLLYPELSGLAAEGESYIRFFGLPVRMVTYSSAIVPVLLAVWAQGYIEKFFKKFVPKMFATFLEPLLTYFVLALITLAVLGPLSTYISDGIAVVLNLIVGRYNWLVGMLLGGLMIPLISTGLHYSLMPIVIGAFMMNGYDTFWAGPSFCSNLALAGAVLGFAAATRNEKMRQTAYSTGATALLGITEPAIYGVAFTENKVLLTGCIAGAAGGLISGILGVNSYGMAPAGLPSMAVLVGPTFTNALISIIVSFVLGFVLSYLSEKRKAA
ncbi:MAG: PTS transporter subunit EIIC [Erysipelotrichaceae bacterium]|nr:PTS transporter subunit EIIC [Erysipelotrichaceae bacterium]